jgi:ubiquinone/menaquinone biosynthesis C-methylase UbiE
MLFNILHLPARLIRHIFKSPAAPGVSVGPVIIDHLPTEGMDGWRDQGVAQRQFEAYSKLIQQARAGHPRLDLKVAARCVELTGLENPFIIEVGCGSGYYSEVIPMFLGQAIRYVGVDYSASMTLLGRQTYPNIPFAIGDACCLPLKDGCCDILLSGNSLMHIPKYQVAIAESMRVSRAYCIFHTVPVMAQRTTTLLTKKAYGQPVVEVIFNQSELETLLAGQGLYIVQRFQSIPYDVSAVVEEQTWTLTYLCRKSDPISVTGRS